jgi:hypothetical protein
MESDRDRISRILQQQFVEARKRRKLASDAFEEANAMPSGLPHPDGTQRMLNAFREYSLALSAVTLAIKRRTDFLAHGIVPDDLK